uniref:Coat protein n=2 Tax=unclassified Megabirnavirus TaxID=1662464 RepID=A0AAU6NDN9_9VIRU
MSATTAFIAKAAKNGIKFSPAPLPARKAWAAPEGCPSLLADFPAAAPRLRPSSAWGRKHARAVRLSYKVRPQHKLAGMLNVVVRAIAGKQIFLPPLAPLLGTEGDVAQHKGCSVAKVLCGSIRRRAVAYAPTPRIGDYIAPVIRLSRSQRKLAALGFPVHLPVGVPVFKSAGNSTRRERNRAARAAFREQRKIPGCVARALPVYASFCRSADCSSDVCVCDPRSVTRLPRLFPSYTTLYVGSIGRVPHVSTLPFAKSRMLTPRNYHHYVARDYYAAVENSFATDKPKVGVTHDDLFATFGKLQSEFRELLNASDSTNLLSVLQNGFIGDKLSHVSLPTAANPNARLTTSLEGSEGHEAITEAVRYHGGTTAGQKHTNLGVSSNSLDENQHELNKTVGIALSNIFEDNELAKSVAPAVTALLGKYGDLNSVRGRTVLYERLLRMMFAARAEVPAPNASNPQGVDMPLTSRSLLPHASIPQGVNGNANWRHNEGANDQERAQYASTLNQRLRALEVGPNQESNAILIPIAGFPTLLSAHHDVAAGDAANRVSDIRRALLGLSRVHLDKCGFAPAAHGRGAASLVEHEKALPAPITLIALDNIVFNAAGVGRAAAFVPINFAHANFNGVASDPRTYKLAIALLLCTIGGADQLTEAFNNVARDAPRFAGPQITMLSSPLHVRYTHAGARAERAAYHRIVYMHTRQIRNTNNAGAAALGSYNPQWPLHPTLAHVTTYDGDQQTDHTAANALTDAVFGNGAHRSAPVHAKEITPCCNDEYISTLAVAFAKSAQRGNLPAAGADLTDLEVDHYWYCLFLNADTSSFDAFRRELAELPLSISDSLITWLSEQGLQAGDDWATRWGYVNGAGAAARVVDLEIQHEGEHVTDVEIRAGYAANRDFIHTTHGLLVDTYTECYVGLTALRNCIIKPGSSIVTDLDRRMAADIIATNDQDIFRVNILRSIAMRCAADFVALRTGLTPTLVDLVRSGSITTDNADLNTALRAYRIPSLGGRNKEVVLELIQTWDLACRSFGIKDSTATQVTKQIHTNARIPMVSNMVSRYPTEVDITFHCMHPATVMMFMPGINHQWKMLSKATTIYTKGIAEFPSLYTSIQVDNKVVTRAMLIAAGERRLAQAGINQRMNMTIRLDDPNMTPEPLTECVNTHYMATCVRMAAAAERDGNMMVPALCLIRNRALERFATLSEPFATDIVHAGSRDHKLRTRGTIGLKSVSLVPSSFSFANAYLSDNHRVRTMISPRNLVTALSRVIAEGGGAAVGVGNGAASTFPNTEDLGEYEFLVRHGYSLIPGIPNAEVVANSTLARIASRSRLAINPLKLKDGFRSDSARLTPTATRIRAHGGDAQVDGTILLPAHNYGFYGTEIAAGADGVVPRTAAVAKFGITAYSAPTYIPNRHSETRDMATCTFFVSLMSACHLFTRWIWATYQSNVHPLIATGKYKYAAIAIDLLREDTTPQEQAFAPEDDGFDFGSWSEQEATDTDAALKETAAAIAAAAEQSRIREERSAAALAEAQARATSLQGEKDALLGELRDLKEVKNPSGGPNGEAGGPGSEKRDSEGPLAPKNT